MLYCQFKPHKTHHKKTHHCYQPDPESFVSSTDLSTSSRGLVDHRRYLIYCSTLKMKRSSSSRASHLESSSECGDDDRFDDEDSSFSSDECKPSYISKGPSSPAHNSGQEHSAIADDLVNDTTTSSSFSPPVPNVWKAADDAVDTGRMSAKLSDSNPTFHHRHKKKKRKVKSPCKDGKSHGLLQAKWDEMFNRLVAYKVKHGQLFSTESLQR